MDNYVTGRRRHAGFTAIELLTTTTVACILLALGIPALKTTLQNNRMASARNSITTHLNLARSEAVKRGIGIVLCPSLSGNNCRNSTLWSDGFMLFVDSNRSRQYEPGEQVLRYIDPGNASIRINSSTGRRKVVYNQYGFASGYNLTFTFCEASNLVQPVAVIVSSSGRARLSATAANGDPLNCS
jgi:type IV fimbrial biogenesis protein FimT